MNVEDHWARAFEVCADEDGYFGPDILDVLSGTSTAPSPRSGSRCRPYSLRSPRAKRGPQQLLQGTDDADIKDFEPDFMSMMDVFDRSAATMNTVIDDLHHLPASIMPRSLQDLAMARWFDADMATERAVTWERAAQLKEQDKIGPDPYREGPGNVLIGNVTEDDHLSNVASLGGAAQTPMMERGFGAALAETVGMDGEWSWNPAAWFGDQNVRSTTSEKARTWVAKLSASRRAQMMRRCATGFTLDGDEDTILKLIDISLYHSKDLVVTIDAANAYDLLSATDGQQYRTMRATFAHYYRYITNDVAMSYIRQAMEGPTGEWHEEMIVDILKAKQFINAEGAFVQDLPLEQSQGHALVSRIGMSLRAGSTMAASSRRNSSTGGGGRSRRSTVRHPMWQGTRELRADGEGGVEEDKPLSERVAMVRRLLSGATGGSMRPASSES